MIIYFDFNAHQTKFIKQQNEQESFAVDFLMEKAQKKDFCGIIDEIFEQNDLVLQILRKEKNFVVLPDQVVGFDNLEVPTVKFATKNKFFKTKFDLLFNQKNNMSVFENLVFKDKNKSIFQFAMIKQDVINQVVETFKKHGVAINGISYFSYVLGEYLASQNRSFSKTNSLVIKNNYNLFAYSNGILLGTKVLEFGKNKQIFAKKYAKFTQNRENLTKYLDKNFEKGIAQTKLEKQNEQSNLSKLEWLVDDFKASFEKSSLKIKFEKVFLINSKFDGQADDINIFDFNNISVEQILQHYKKSPLYSLKRSFWI